MTTAARLDVGRLLCLDSVDGVEKRYRRLVMESNERFDEIMTCSKEAIARAYMCRSATLSARFICPSGAKVCPFKYTPCDKVTPQDWQEVLDGHNGGATCITE